MPAQRFAYRRRSNWRTFLLPIHFAGNREKTKNPFDAMSRFSKNKGIPAAQASEVWQRIVGAARAHGMTRTHDSIRAKETETAPQASALPGSANPYNAASTQGHSEKQVRACCILVTERLLTDRTAELMSYEE